MDIATEAARLREAAQLRPMKLPINRKVDERHHSVTADGLSVWFTIQISPHARIEEAIFERADRAPSDEECRPWLDLLFRDVPPAEAPGMPGALSRRFEVFDHDPAGAAPVA